MAAERDFRFAGCAEIKAKFAARCFSSEIKLLFDRAYLLWTHFLRVEIRRAFVVGSQFFQTLLNDLHRFVAFQSPNFGSVPAIAKRSHFASSYRNVKFKF